MGEKVLTGTAPPKILEKTGSGQVQVKTGCREETNPNQGLQTAGTELANGARRAQPHQIRRQTGGGAVACVLRKGPAAGRLRGARVPRQGRFLGTFSCPAAPSWHGLPLSLQRTPEAGRAARLFVNNTRAPPSDAKGPGRETSGASEVSATLC